MEQPSRLDLTGLDDRPVPGDSRWLLDPPANDGRKVVLSDTDHYSPFESTALWAWKSFLRGHNPILYDLGIIGGAACGPGLRHSILQFVGGRAVRHG